MPIANRQQVWGFQVATCGLNCAKTHVYRQPYHLPLGIQASTCPHRLHWPRPFSTLRSATSNLILIPRRGSCPCWGLSRVLTLSLQLYTHPTRTLSFCHCESIPRSLLTSARYSSTVTSLFLCRAATSLSPIPLMLLISVSVKPISLFGGLLPSAMHLSTISL